MKQDMIDKIKKNIEESGFPTELQVLGICSTRNTGRMPSIRYAFRGEEKELDLLAFFESIRREPRGEENPQHTVTNMIIECKKSKDKPWVFFSSTCYPGTGNLLYFLCYVSDFDAYFESKRQLRLLGQIYKHCTKNHYAHKEIPMCIAYSEAFKNPSAPSEIYKGIDSVLSFLLCDMESRYKRRKQFDCFTSFYYPIIVLDGEMVEAKAEDGSIRIEERDHIQLRTTYDREIYIIDVVRKDYFDKFFDLIHIDHDEFVDSIGRIKLPRHHKRAIIESGRKRVKQFIPRIPPEPYVRRMDSEA